jgi:hypothetical protein
MISLVVQWTVFVCLAVDVIGSKKRAEHHRRSKDPG